MTWRLAGQGRFNEGRICRAWRRTSDSLDGKRAIDTTRAAVFIVIVGRLVQIFRTTEEARKDPTRLAGFGDCLPCGESLSVFSYQNASDWSNRRPVSDSLECGCLSDVKHGLYDGQVS